jgi:hypothetical protein
MKEKQFCVCCGKRMKRNFVEMHFNPEDGSQHFNIVWFCPDYRWWRFWQHSKWKSDEDGNTYQFEI